MRLFSRHNRTYDIDSPLPSAATTRLAPSEFSARRPRLSLPMLLTLLPLVRDAPSRTSSRATSSVETGRVVLRPPAQTEGKGAS